LSGELNCLGTSNDEVNYLIDHIVLCEHIRSGKEERKKIRIVLEGALVLTLLPGSDILTNLVSEKLEVLSDLAFLLRPADGRGDERLSEPVKRVTESDVRQ